MRYPTCCVHGVDWQERKPKNWVMFLYTLDTHPSPLWILLPPAPFLKRVLWLARCPMHRFATSICQLRHDQMEQGPTEPRAGRSTFLLSSGGAWGRVLLSGLWYGADSY